jgi:hypothetical protein
MKASKSVYDRFQKVKPNGEKDKDRFAFQALPKEMKQRVVGFLPASDTMYLIQTCKTMTTDLELNTESSPLTDRASLGMSLGASLGTIKVFENCNLQCFAVIIPKDSDRLHSMTFHCIENDAGRNDNNRIVVVEQDMPAHPSPDGLSSMNELPFQNGEVVARSPSQRDRHIALSFYPKPNKIYQLWCATVDYFDSEWRLENMSLHRFGFASNAATDYIAFQYEVRADRRRKQYRGMKK